MSNLLDIVDLADECGTNPYWRMNDTDRDLFSKYAEQKLNTRRPASIPEEISVDDKKDDRAPAQASDTDIADDVHVDVSDDDAENDDSSGVRTEVEAGVLPADREVDDTNIEAPKSGGREKSARWLEYVKEARKDIKSEGVAKPDNKAVNQRAREYLQADGWL
jgi:hypothetical protein